jgi:hypothetical protein
MGESTAALSHTMNELANTTITDECGSPGLKTPL